MTYYQKMQLVLLMDTHTVEQAANLLHLQSDIVAFYWQHIKRLV